MRISVVEWNAIFVNEQRSVNLDAKLLMVSSVRAQVFGFSLTSGGRSRKLGIL